MEILYILVPVALVLAGAGLLGFRWAVRDGQFDDLDSPAIRVLFDEDGPSNSRTAGPPPPTHPPFKKRSP